jgi:NADH-quinone oxidoreductase subunit J
LRQGFWSYLPLGGTIGLLMVAQMLLVLSGRYFGLENFPGQDVAAGASNTKDLARLMFTKYAFPFEIASLILLVGIIGAVMLTLRKRADSKAVDPPDQIKVKRNDRVRMVKMTSETDAPVAVDASSVAKGE